jgi:tyrosine-protein kinase
MLTVDELIRIVWRRRAVFVVTFLVALAAAAAVTFSTHKQYSTTAYLYISAGSPSASAFDQVQISQVTTKTYAELLQTRNVANLVAGKLPFPMSGKAVQSAVGVSPVSGSALITLTASASTPARAQTIANTYAATFVGNAASLASGNLGATKITLAEPATLMTSPVKPRPKLYMLIGAIVALFIATGAALLRHRTDQRLELEPSATEVGELPVLARIPRAPASALALSSVDPHADVSTHQIREAFQMLFANIAFANSGKLPRSLAVVSTAQSEGKSTVCAHVARAAAERGVSTLLVDADLRRGRLQSLLEVDRARLNGGLSSLLLDYGALPLSEPVLELDDPHVSLLPAGPAPPNPAALLGAEALRSLIEEARQQYELVVLDTPPISIGADAALVAAVVEAAVLVIDLPSTRRSALAQAINQLRQSQTRIVGVVVNRAGGAGSSYDYTHADHREGRGRRSGAAPRQLASSGSRRS